MTDNTPNSPDRGDLPRFGCNWLGCLKSICAKFKKKKIPMEYVIPISKTETIVITEDDLKSYLKNKT